jgi:hypothetical protein
VVRFSAPYDVVADRLLAHAGTLEPLDATSCRFVSAVDTWEWLAVTIALVGVPYTIEGPPEFIAFSRTLADRINNATR